MENDNIIPPFCLQHTSDSQKTYDFVTRPHRRRSRQLKEQRCPHFENNHRHLHYNPQVHNKQKSNPNHQSLHDDFHDLHNLKPHLSHRSLDDVIYTQNHYQNHHHQDCSNHALQMQVEGLNDEYRDQRRKSFKNRNNNNNRGKKNKSRKGPIHINVNGRLFVLSKSTCIRIPVLQGMLTRMRQSQSRTSKDTLKVEGSKLAEDKSSKISDELFFERNSTIFAAVVDYVQNNELHVPPHVCPKLFARDLSFWGFDIDEVESCCFSGVVHFLWEQDRLTKFHGFLRPKTGFEEQQTDTGEFTDTHVSPTTTSWKHVREEVWKVLDEPFTGKIARAYFYVMCLFILTSFFTIAADTVSELKTRDMTYARESIAILSYVCAAYLYVDYSLRILFYPKLRRFCRDFVNITDGLAVLSSIAKIVTQLSMDPGTDHSTKTWVGAIDSLQLLRILRLLRPMSKVIGFRLIYFTLKCSFHELLLVFMLLMFLTMIFSSLLYYLGDRDSIKSIPHAMWFSLTTMTTVGYGDIVPGKARTKVIGSVVAVFGVILMSMTMPIMVSNFNLLYINAVVGQPSAIKKVHQELEKAHLDGSSFSFGGPAFPTTTGSQQQMSGGEDESPPVQEDTEEKLPDGPCSALKKWFRTFRRREKDEKELEKSQPPIIPDNILDKLSFKPRYPTDWAERGRESAPDSEGGGSDADGELSENELTAQASIQNYLRNMSKKNKNFIQSRHQVEEEEEEPPMEDREGPLLDLEQPHSRASLRPSVVLGYSQSRDRLLSFL